MSPKNRQFGSFIAKRRKAKGMSLAQVAEAVGVTKSNVHYWEVGDVLPKPSVLPGLAEALDVPHEDLFALAGYAPPAGLPTVTPYLRAKYGHLPEAALEEAEAFFRELESRYGEEHGDSP